MFEYYSLVCVSGCLWIKYIYANLRKYLDPFTNIVFRCLINFIILSLQSEQVKLIVNMKVIHEKHENWSLFNFKKFLIKKSLPFKSSPKDVEGLKKNVFA